MTSISLIIPTYNEADNIPVLYAELQGALSSIDWEVVFVDDSTDATPDVIRSLVAANENITAVLRTCKRGLS